MAELLEFKRLDTLAQTFCEKQLSGIEWKNMVSLSIVFDKQDDEGEACQEPHSSSFFLRASTP
ncbi:hypothetical protein GCM10009425_27090 [Pseudomonas asuensis]|uniref:Uncharacterized protein n=1 Tax=Pseudomonas asuensis TaxID=1825787 RepID=A0ABQ2GUZ9_9PSED|nr:hypothetical protein GCM10009425_27090 [Pseudomonas asuensis]